MGISRFFFSIKNKTTSLPDKSMCVWRHCQEHVIWGHRHEPLVALDSHCAERWGLRYQGGKNQILRCEHICVCLSPTCKEE